MSSVRPWSQDCAAQLLTQFHFLKAPFLFRETHPEGNSSHKMRPDHFPSARKIICHYVYLSKWCKAIALV